MIDSASIRAADTVPARSRGYDAGKRVNGRKRHLAVDTSGLLLAVVVTIAGLQDRDGACPLLAALRARFSTITLVWADGGYAGRLVAWARAVLGFAVTIVKRTDDLTGFRVIPRRWVGERTLAWISKHRRCVRDYETLPEHSEAMVYIAMIMTMSRRLARHLAADLRRPWERPLPPERLTLARVRRGFRHLRVKITLPARAPNPAIPGPAARPGGRTATAPPATTSAQPSREPPPTPAASRSGVKRQA